jgi:hypothetical protein
MEEARWHKAPALPVRARPAADPLEALLDAVFTDEVGEWPSGLEILRVTRYHRPARRRPWGETFGWELDTSALVIDAVGPHRMLAAA